MKNIPEEISIKFLTGQKNLIILTLGDINPQMIKKTALFLLHIKNLKILLIQLNMKMSLLII